MKSFLFILLVLHQYCVFAESITPYFIPFFMRFKIEAELAQIDVKPLKTIVVVKFDPPEQDLPSMAVCYKKIENEKETREIHLQAKFLQMSSELQYKAFLHLIGHCAYDLQHIGDKDAIMANQVIESKIDFKILEQQFFNMIKEKLNSSSKRHVIP